MMKRLFVILTALWAIATPQLAYAEDLFTARNIRVGSVIGPSDIVTPKSAEALRRASKMIGMEAARNLYKGKAVGHGDLRLARIVERNAIVAMTYQKGPLVIEAEGRALDDGGMGERVRVLNLQSKRIISATIIGANHVRAN